MAILHVVQFALPEIPSGYTIRTAAILRQQRSQGIDPVVVTSPRHPTAPERSIEGIPHYRSGPQVSAGSVWLRDWLRVRSLARRIEQVAAERGDLSLLHAHSPVLCGMAALRAGRRLGLPVVYEVRGLWEEAMVQQSRRSRWSPRYLLAQRMETRVCSRADAVVAISHGLQKELIARGIPERKTHVVPNGVDLTQFSPGHAPPSWRSDHGLSDGPLILYLGAIRGYEGVDLLLKAFRLVREGDPQAQLLIVGQGADRDRIAAETSRLGRGVTILPPVPHSEVPGFYAAADVVVYPRLSTRATELVTPLKPLEAMAMAKAIVASDVGGLRELLSDGETARLFAAGSETGLAEALSALLRDDPLCRRLGEAARQAASERFDWQAMAQRYREVYRAAGIR